MLSVIKRVSAVPYTFGGESPEGWLPAGSTTPPRTPAVPMRLDIAILTNDGDGYILEWRGATSAHSGDRWYADLAGAEQAALELFGVRSGDWAPAV